MNKQLEKKIIQATHQEGIGSQYERLVLSRFFLKLSKTHQFNSVLEYSAGISKGLDNITFINQSKKVTIADTNYKKLKAIWPKDYPKTNFCSLTKAPKSELVWNFAIVHLRKTVLQQMIKRSNKYILIFTPNLYNWGAPIHHFFHLITKTKCRHPERGDRRTRTLSGLKDTLTQKNLEIVETGYVDMPIWPDFAFSKMELFKGLGIKTKASNKNTNTPKASVLHTTLNKQTKLLEYNLPGFLQPIIAHHQYVLAQKLSK